MHTYVTRVRMDMEAFSLTSWDLCLSLWFIAANVTAKASESLKHVLCEDP